MALPVHIQIRYWAAAAAVLLLAMWFLGQVILPFVIGGAVAYLLDPVADRLQRLGIGRAAATALISLVALFIVVALVLAVIPTLVNQFAALINAAPDIFRQLHDFTLERFPDLAEDTSTARQTLMQIGDAIRARGGEVAQAILGTAGSLLNAVILIVVVPVVSFYLLLDWDRMLARIDALLPRDHAPVVRRLAAEIDTVLAAFVRGQLSVCLIMGIYYAVGLMLAGLQLEQVVGGIAGGITFIPYVGAIVGGALALGLALFQFWGDWVSIGIVAGIFALGQFLEGNIITPRVVGDSVGLHPVWLLFALSVFGSLFGFLGMLIAVPLAAAIGVLTRFALGQYQESLLYRGAGGRALAEAGAAAEAAAEAAGEAEEAAQAGARAVKRARRAGPGAGGAG
ncbi:MAG TPA: AI-2E family transporter [Paracoccaceae bacterium]|nr:AI-2E family transporter [Paracoccaceae bacterium]